MNAITDRGWDKYFGPSITNLIFNFNLHKAMVPDDVRYYYRYAEYFFSYTLIGEAITKAVEYPLSNIVVQAENDEALEETTQIIRNMKLKESMIKAGIHTHTYGTSYTVPRFPIKKYIECRSCGKRYSLEDLHKYGSPTYSYSSGKISYTCTEEDCKQKGVNTQFRTIERTTNDPNKIMVKVYDPYYIDRDYNEMTGDVQYSMKIPESFKRRVSASDHFLISTTPQVLLEAVHEGMKVRLNKERLFVMDAHTMTIKDVPIPPLVRSFLNLYLHMQYMAANQQIADDMLVPFRMLFPISRTESNKPTVQTINHSDWRDYVREELSKRSTDPGNYVSIMPIEMGSKDIWGNGKMYAMNAELESNMAEAVAAQGYPIEFIRGGATWSRQNTSAITLENKFKSDCETYQDLLDHVSDMINRSKKFSTKIKLMLKPPILVEQMAQQSYLDKGHDKGEIDHETYYRPLGIDYSQVQKIQKNNFSKRVEMATDEAKIQATAQVEAAKITTNAQIAQREAERIESAKDAASTLLIQKDQTNMQLDMMRQQLGIQLEGQYNQHQLEKQIQAEDQQEQYKQQAQQMYDELTFEQKTQLDSMTPEDRAKQIDAMLQQKQMEDFYNSLDKSRKDQIDALPKDQQMPLIQKFMQDDQKDQEIAQTNPSLYAKKEEMKLQEDLEQKELYTMASALNRLEGTEAEMLKGEMMNEDTTKFSKVKEIADTLVIFSTVEKLFSLVTPQEKQAIIDGFVVNHPELIDDLQKEMDRQCAMQSQAQAWARKLLQVSGKPEFDQLLEKMKNETPPEFREYVVRYYGQFKEAKNMNVVNHTIMESVKQKTDASDSIIREVAMNLNSYPDKQKMEMLNILKYENPSMYTKVINYSPGKR